MSIIKVQYKVKKVEARDSNGVMQKKFIPICKKSLFGIGFWKECEDWKATEEQIAGEKYLGLDTDSTLTHIRAFIDKNDPNPKNEYYNE